MHGISVTLAAEAQGKEFPEARIRPLTDTGIQRTIVNLKDWLVALKLLLILGRAKLMLQAEAVATINTEVYINNSETEESLL